MRTSKIGDKSNASQYNLVSNNVEKIKTQINIIELRTPILVPA